MPVGRTQRIAVGNESCALKAHVLDAGIHQFQPHVNGESDGNEPDKGRDDQVQDTDVFVVGGHEPPGKETPVVFMIVPVNGCVCHAVPPQKSNLDTPRLLAKPWCALHRLLVA